MKIKKETLIKWLRLNAQSFAVQAVPSDGTEITHFSVNFPLVIELED